MTIPIRHLLGLPASASDAEVAKAKRALDIADGAPVTAGLVVSAAQRKVNEAQARLTQRAEAYPADITEDERRERALKAARAYEEQMESQQAALRAIVAAAGQLPERYL